MKTDYCDPYSRGARVHSTVDEIATYREWGEGGQWKWKSGGAWKSGSGQANSFERMVGVRVMAE